MTTASNQSPKGLLPPDCGEAGHDEGRCGNASCMPGKWGKLLRNARDHAYDEEGCTLHPDLAEAVDDVDALLDPPPIAAHATDEQVADALNTLCKMMHSGEEVEGDDGLAMLVPMDLWNEAQEAIELLVGGE